MTFVFLLFFFFVANPLLFLLFLQSAFVGCLRSSNRMLYKSGKERVKLNIELTRIIPPVCCSFIKPQSCCSFPFSVFLILVLCGCARFDEHAHLIWWVVFLASKIRFKEKPTDATLKVFFGVGDWWYSVWWWRNVSVPSRNLLPLGSGSASCYNRGYLSGYNCLSLVPKKLQNPRAA